MNRHDAAAKKLKAARALANKRKQAERMKQNLSDPVYSNLIHEKWAAAQRRWYAKKKFQV